MHPHLTRSCSGQPANNFRNCLSNDELDTINQLRTLPHALNHPFQSEVSHHMISDPVLLALWFRNVCRLLFSNKPDYVQALAEIEHDWRAKIERSFMAGYNATPEQKAQWKSERQIRKNRYGWIHVAFILPALFLLFALLHVLWSILALTGRK
jgi:hypothetical protein